MDRHLKLASKCDGLIRRIETKDRRHESTADDRAQLKQTRLKQLRSEIRQERRMKKVG